MRTRESNSIIDPEVRSVVTQYTAPIDTAGSEAYAKLREVCSPNNQRDLHRADGAVIDLMRARASTLRPLSENRA